MTITSYNVAGTWMYLPVQLPKFLLLLSRFAGITFDQSDKYNEAVFRTNGFRVTLCYVPYNSTVGIEMIVIMFSSPIYA